MRFILTIFLMIKEIQRVEKIIHNLCDLPINHDLPPLEEIDPEYQHQIFESPVENLNYLLDIVDDLIGLANENKNA